MKDNFSKQSANYAAFRPQYPDALFDFILPLVRQHHVAWDVATGNGQVASKLADHFRTVKATDISGAQLAHAIRKPNIEYRIGSSEKSEFRNESFDLITVAQAIHWFRFEDFYKEVMRTLKPEGLIAVIGYPLFSVNKDVDEMITDFYSNTLSGYWDPERKYLDEHYATIPFPFNEIAVPPFYMEYHWSLAHLVGFLKSWSGVQHYTSRNNNNPVEELQARLSRIWSSDEKKSIHFPLIVKLGKKVG